MRNGISWPVPVCWGSANLFARSTYAPLEGVPLTTRQPVCCTRSFPTSRMPDSCWEDAAQLRDRLAEKGWHQCTSPIDLLVAVTASHHKLTVLHADSDFETIGRLTGQPLQRID